jgi:hypothetical protein
MGVIEILKQQNQNLATNTARNNKGKNENDDTATTTESAEGCIEWWHSKFSASVTDANCWKLRV